MPADEGRDARVFGKLEAGHEVLDGDAAESDDTVAEGAGGVLCGGECGGGSGNCQSSEVAPGESNDVVSYLNTIQQRGGLRCSFMTLGSFCNFALLRWYERDRD
jgi:hypothetical protein